MCKNRNSNACKRWHQRNIAKNGDNPRNVEAFTNYLRTKKDGQQNE